MLRFLFIFILTFSGLSQAAEIKLGVFPGFSYSGQTVGVLRANTSVLFGSDVFLAGVYGEYDAFFPEVNDTSGGLALHIGKDYYFEFQAGVFTRTFEQSGTNKLTGTGYAANLIFGGNLNSWLGLDLALLGKQITSGGLDKRTIVDLLPLIAMRMEF